MAAAEPIPDEWRDNLSPRWRPYVADLEARLDEALRRLERARGRVRRVRELRRRVRALEAENQRLRGLIGEHGLTPGE